MKKLFLLALVVVGLSSLSYQKIEQSFKKIVNENKEIKKMIEKPLKKYPRKW
ncbi:MAG: hypothetical protein WCP39_05175 [Chlamydiota bacterium]